MESSFASLADVAGRFFPIPKSALKVTTRAFSFETYKAIANVDAQILIAHSRSDEMIPAWQAEKNYDAASEPKALHWFRGGHNHEKSGQTRFQAAITELCDSALAWHQKNA